MSSVAPSITGRGGGGRNSFDLHYDNPAVYVVYLLQSLFFRSQRYVGLTKNLTQRLEEHNSGKSSHTSKFMPWELVAAIHFKSEINAREFEAYLKSGSGHAFAKRHFYSD